MLGFEIEKNKIRTSHNTVEHQNTSPSSVVIYNTEEKKPNKHLWMLGIIID